jgi:hypothetical protein
MKNFNYSGCIYPILGIIFWYTVIYTVIHFIIKYW